MLARLDATGIPPASKGSDMKTAKKTKATKSKRPTYAEMEERLHSLRRKVWLLRKSLDGEAAHLEFWNACGVEGVETTEEREHKAGALRRAAYGLDYVMQGEG